jgi:oligopeptide/dipeptide ABC transporter ATP-binding protein
VTAPVSAGRPAAPPEPREPPGPVVLDVVDLHAHLETRWGLVRAVDGVSLTLREGETLGLVGESGSGKTMTALAILRLLPRPAGRIVKGAVLLDGEDLVAKSEREMRRVRGRRISMVLQDPQTSLNPVFTIGNQLVEAFRLHVGGAARALRQRAEDALRQVRVAAPAQRLRDFPHQMSGGMKQRVVGAIAVAGAPRVLIADEPTTALDVTIQLQYLALLQDIQARTRLGMLFITHDFGIVARMCDRVAVMYAGRIVETGPMRALFAAPRHPYTEALMAAVPQMDAVGARLAAIDGQPPALHRLPPGCRFAPRCRYVEPRCHAEYPPAFAVGPAHEAACWRAEPSASR